MWSPAPRTATDAIEQLRQAIALDPHYSDAWGDLAYIQAFTSTWMGKPVPNLLETSHSAAIALFLSPTNVCGLLAQGYVEMLVNHDKTAAASYYGRAQATDLDFSLCAFEMAFCYYGPFGQYDEAIAALKKAEGKDPLSSTVKYALIEMYLASGRVGEAIVTAEALQKLGLTDPEAAATVGSAFLAAGDLRRAREALDATRGMVSDDFLISALLTLAIDAASGDRAEYAENCSTAC